MKNGLATGTNAGKAGISQLNTDSTGAVYGTGWVFANAATGNLEGIFAAEGDTGAVRWIADCHGDHYGVYSDGTNVYSTGHEHDCQTAGGLPQGSGNPGNMKNATVYTAAVKGTLSRSPSVSTTYADWSGYPAPAAVNWYADWMVGTATGQGQAGWTATGNGEYLLIGGEFPLVNNIRSQGIARFAVHPAGGPKQGPRLSGRRLDADGEVGRVRLSPRADPRQLGPRRPQHHLSAVGAGRHAAARDDAPRPRRSGTARRRCCRPSGFTPGSSQTFYVIGEGRRRQLGEERRRHRHDQRRGRVRPTRRACSMTTPACTGASAPATRSAAPTSPAATTPS